MSVSNIYSFPNKFTIEAYLNYRSGNARTRALNSLIAKTFSNTKLNHQEVGEKLKRVINKAGKDFGLYEINAVYVFYEKAFSLWKVKTKSTSLVKEFKSLSI